MTVASDRTERSSGLSRSGTGNSLHQHQQGVSRSGTSSSLHQHQQGISRSGTGSSLHQHQQNRSSSAVQPKTPPQTRVLSLNDGENTEHILYRLQKGCLLNSFCFLGFLFIGYLKENECIS